MLTALVITLREGLEAALVVAVVLSFLNRSGEGRLKRFAWYGVAAACQPAWKPRALISPKGTRCI